MNSMLNIKMQAAVIFFALILSLSSAEEWVCADGEGVEDFAVSVYTGLIELNDPKYVDHLSLPGDEAGRELYQVVQQCLEKYKQCDADEVAFTAGQTLISLSTLTMPDYFNHTAYTIGRSIYKFGILDCSNAIALSLEYLQYFQEETDGLDPSKFKDYMHALVYAIVDLYLAHGLKLEDTALETADVFHKLYQDVKPKCKFDH